MCRPNRTVARGHENADVGKDPFLGVMLFAFGSPTDQRYLRERAHNHREGCFEYQVQVLLNEATYFTR